MMAATEYLHDTMVGLCFAVYGSGAGRGMTNVPCTPKVLALAVTYPPVKADSVAVHRDDIPFAGEGDGPEHCIVRGGRTKQCWYGTGPDHADVK